VPGVTWVNEPNFFWMKHTPDTGSIARPGGLQPNALLPTSTHDDECCFRPGFALMRLYLGRGATWVNEATFMNHTPDTGSIGRPGGLKPSALPIELRLLPTLSISTRS
jgi:hypothetical protein